MAAQQVTRIAPHAQEIAQALQVSLNGVSAHDVALAIGRGDYAAVKADSAYAIVSRNGNCVCIEAIEGHGGTELAASLVRAARAAGLTCEAWVLSKGRARLAKRAGMSLTGVSRMSASGAIQFQVST